MVGIVILIAFSVPRKWYEGGARLVVLLAGTAVAAGVLIWFTAQQTGYWKDTETLFTHTIAVTRPNDYARSALAFGYVRAGKFDQAIEEYKEIREVIGGTTPPDIGIGMVYLQKEEPEKAVPYLQQGVERDSKNGDSYHTLGVALALCKRWSEAVEAFRKAVALSPGEASYQADLEKAQKEAGM
jgi:predicted Zn-dependent protease